MAYPRTKSDMNRSGMEIVQYPATEIPNARFLMLDFRDTKTNYDIMKMAVLATQAGMKMLQFKDTDFTLATIFDTIWLVGDAQTASMFKLMHDPPIKACLKRSQMEDLMSRATPNHLDMIYETRAILDIDSWAEEAISRIHNRPRKL